MKNHNLRMTMRKLAAGVLAAVICTVSSGCSSIAAPEMTEEQTDEANELIDGFNEIIDGVNDVINGFENAAEGIGSAADQIQDASRKIEEAGKKVGEQIGGLGSDIEEQIGNALDALGQDYEESDPVGDLLDKIMHDGKVPEFPHIGGAVSETLPEASDTRTAFDAFLEEYLLERTSDDYTTMHWAFADPDEAGIDREEIPVTLGPVVIPPEEARADARELADRLKEFKRSELSDIQQDMYDWLLFEAQISEKLADDRFYGLDNIWSSSKGIHQVLVSHFSEYSLYNEQDIKDMIVLIRDVPRFVDEALDYTREQADAGLLCFDYDALKESIGTVLDAREDSAILRTMEQTIDSLNLDPETAASYKEQAAAAMAECFYPSYEKILDEMEKLEDKILPPAGLGSLPNGKDYYVLLVQDNVGTTDGIRKIRQALEDSMDREIARLSILFMNGKDISEMEDPTDLPTGFDSIEDILTFLEDAYREEFPEVGDMPYELEGISDERAADFAAYFVVPSLDNPNSYQICYNALSMGEDADTIDMYQTIAHEGIPGHMYQTQFNHENLPYPLARILGKTGFTEGWAVYASVVALPFIQEISDELLVFYGAYTTYLNTIGAQMELEIHYNALTEEEFIEGFGMLFEEDMLSETYRHLADNVIYYMPYYYGYSRLAEFRQEAEKELKDKFDAPSFHRAVLKAGSAPFDIVQRNVKKYIKERK